MPGTRVGLACTIDFRQTKGEGPGRNGPARSFEQKAHGAHIVFCNDNSVACRQ